MCKKKKYILLVKMTIDNQETCAICLELLGEGGKNTCHLDCSHRFHTECLLQSFQRDVRCPICRVDMVAPPPVTPSSSQQTIVEINLNELNNEYLQHRRQLKNYQSRVNRYVNKTPELKKLKDSIKVLNKESNDCHKLLRREWSRVEREAWAGESMSKVRMNDAKKRRQLSNALNRYTAIVEEKFGEAPQESPSLSLQTLLRTRGEELLFGQFISGLV